MVAFCRLGARQNAAGPTESIVRVADLRGQRSSEDVRRIADWIAATRDASGSAFVVVDKRDARIYVFDADARLRASSPVLLGGARGDDTVPGIGTRQISDVLPEERTTPAGRFVGERGHNARGEDVVWVDYDAAVSMHRVLTLNPEERRLERLDSSVKLRQYDTGHDRGAGRRAATCRQRAGGVRAGSVRNRHSAVVQRRANLLRQRSRTLESSPG